jgi:hypothetical protein
MSAHLSGNAKGPLAGNPVNSNGKVQVSKRFLSAFGIITSHFQVGRHFCTASVFREMMKRRFIVWKQVVGIEEAA